MTMPPHLFWQDIHPAGTFDFAPTKGFTTSFPVRLPDGREVLLPTRELPTEDMAVASLIINQASFAVQDAIGTAVTDIVAAVEPEVIVGVPTLGLTLANNVARKLNHDRLVALGTSRKFWYDDELSHPITSITTPGKGKRVFIDPRMIPLLRDRRVVIVDDVISSGTSIAAVLELMANCGINVVAVACAMVQSDVWKESLTKYLGDGKIPVLAPLSTPFLKRGKNGNWYPVEDDSSTGPC